MESLDLFPETKGVVGWGFFRATCNKYGVPHTLFEGLFAQLLSGDINCKEVRLSHEERKWEVVSGYQKAVRRGELEEALRLASAIINHPQELPYLWRRVCTTAAEDVGFANPLLVAFVILCAATYTPSKFVGVQRRVIYGLTRLMCESVKDRSMCDMSVIQNHGAEAIHACALTPSEQGLYETILGAKKVEVDSPVLMYLQKQTWRTEDMGQFFPLVSTMASNLSVVSMEISPSERLKGIKSYAYDMHTRVGKKSLVILTGREAIREFFKKYPVADKPKVLGWALFYCEGGLLDKQILYDGRDELYNLAVKAPLCSMGIPPEVVVDLLHLVDEMLPELNDIREYVLRPLYV